MKRINYLLLGIIIAPIVLACGWDYDTIAMERKKFPNIHELIVGKFLHHSQEFYHWRIIDRQLKLKTFPDSLALYDDLAVAYDKTGQHVEAIQTMDQKEALSPGLYETYANQGTFYIHNGQYEEGVVLIDKAIEINPDAHFGREVYQKHLVNYVIQKKGDAEELSLPLAKTNRENNFYDYLVKKEFRGEGSEKDLAKAIKGISGMMHFGNYQSPVLLEALGDLLLETETQGGSGHLGARAYLKASFQVKDETVSKKYWNKADDAREKAFGPERIVERMSPAQKERYIASAPSAYKMKYLEAALKYEIQSAEAWFDTVRMNEISWINQKLNADSAFAVAYYDPGNVHYIRETQVYKNNLVDEEAWLNRQLNRPDSVSYKIHNFESLPDSVVDNIWSLYDEEFAVFETDGGTLEEESSSEEKTDETEEEPASNKRLWLIVGFSALLVGLVYLRFRFSKNRK